MDNLDQKILIELQNNSRTPITALAKKLKTSREVINYRIKKLSENKIILGFITEIDFEKLGFQYSSLSLSIKSSREKDLKKYLTTCPFTAWTSEFSGVWNFGIGVFGKNAQEIHQNFSTIYNKFKKDIIDHRLIIHRSTKHFYEKYLNTTKQQSKNTEVEHKPDKKDLTILKELANDSRLDSVKLSSKVNLTAPATANRIKKLEKSGFIKKYSIFIDPSKLGLYQFSVFITNKELKNNSEITPFLEKHPSVSFIVEYFGDPFIEFGIIVNDPYNMRKIVQQIEETFPGNRVTETFLIQKEILSIGPPDCVFE
jgi:DNA-binding Lrp family transcriptional regulator